MTQCHTMNDPTQRSGGRLTAHFDGHQVLDTDLWYRATPDLGIDRVFFAAFRGGSDQSWAVDTHGHLLLNDVTVTVEPDVPANADP